MAPAQHDLFFEPRCDQLGNGRSRAPRFAAPLSKRCFAGAVAPRCTGLFRSVLCTVMGSLKKSRFGRIGAVTRLPRWGD